MQIGVVFPQTEFGNDPVAMRDYAQTVEGLGYSHVLAYDHVLGANPERPGGWSGPYTYETPFHEPFVLFGFMAALTTRLSLHHRRHHPAAAADGAGGQAGGVARRGGGRALPAGHRRGLECGGVRGAGRGLCDAWPAQRGADRPVAPAVDGAARHRARRMARHLRRRHQSAARAAADPHLAGRACRRGAGARGAAGRRLAAQLSHGGGGGARRWRRSTATWRSRAARAPTSAWSRGCTTRRARRRRGGRRSTAGTRRAPTTSRSTPWAAASRRRHSTCKRCSTLPRRSISRPKRSSLQRAQRGAEVEDAVVAACLRVRCGVRSSRPCGCEPQLRQSPISRRRRRSQRRVIVRGVEFVHRDPAAASRSYADTAIPAVDAARSGVSTRRSGVSSLRLHRDPAAASRSYADRGFPP